MAILTEDEVYKIYLNNYEFINKSFKQRGPGYGTLFEKEMVNFWICDGELITNKTRINPKNHFNESGRSKVCNMEFKYNDGYLISQYLINKGCTNYKFKCQ